MPFKWTLSLACLALSIGCAKSIQDNGAKVGRAQTNKGVNAAGTPAAPSTTATTNDQSATTQPYGNLLALETQFTDEKLRAIAQKSAAAASAAAALKLDKVECPTEGCLPSAVLVEIKSTSEARYCTGFHLGKNQIQFPLDCMKDKKISESICSQQMSIYSNDGKSTTLQKAECKKLVGVVQSDSSSAKFKDGQSEAYAIVEADKNLPGALTAKRTELTNLQLKNVVGYSIDLSTQKISQFAQDCHVALGTEYLPKSYSGYSLNVVLSGPNCKLPPGAMGALILSDDQKSVEGQMIAASNVQKEVFIDALKALNLDYKVAATLYTPYLAQVFRCSRLTLEESRPVTCDREESASRTSAFVSNTTKFQNGYRNESLYQMARDWYASYPNNAFLYTFEFAIVENKTWTFMPKPKCAIAGVYKANENASQTTIPYAQVIKGINSFGFAGLMADTAQTLKVEMQFNRDQIGGGLNSVFVLKNLDSTAPISSKLEGYFNQARADINFCEENDPQLQNEFSMSNKGVSSN